MDATRQLSNLDERVVDFLKTVIAPRQNRVMRTVPPVIAHDTILSEQQVADLINADRVWRQHH